MLVLAAVDPADLSPVADSLGVKFLLTICRLATMPKSKASLDGDDHLLEFQLLKQDVQENQNELSAIRADLSTVSSKQDQFNTAVDGMQSSVNDLSLQITAMSDALKSLHLSQANKQPETVLSENPVEDRQRTSAGAVDQAILIQKRLEIEALRRQLQVEQDFSRKFQHALPNARRSAPPGFGQASSSHMQVNMDDTDQDSRVHQEQNFNSQPNPWLRYTKDYEQEMRNQFLKNITKGPRLDFPKFDGANPVEWIRQCEKCFQMSATPEEFKFSLAQLYIVGKADVWLRRSKILKNNPTWPKFCEMLLERFSSHSSYQLVESFNNLMQNNSSVTDYAEVFEELMATVTEENPELSEAWFVRCFVNGLTDGIDGNMPKRQ